LPFAADCSLFVGADHSDHRLQSWSSSFFFAGVGRQAPELEISAAAGDQLIIIVLIELLL
jgi:hypothetical protein